MVSARRTLGALRSVVARRGAVDAIGAVTRHSGDVAPAWMGHCSGDRAMPALCNKRDCVGAARCIVHRVVLMQRVALPRTRRPRAVLVRVGPSVRLSRAMLLAPYEYVT